MLASRRVETRSMCGLKNPATRTPETAARDAGATRSSSGQGDVHSPASKRATGMSTPSDCRYANHEGRMRGL